LLEIENVRLKINQIEMTRTSEDWILMSSNIEVAALINTGI
jgi:hypothetical protein